MNCTSLTLICIFVPVFLSVLTSAWSFFTTFVGEVSDVLWNKTFVSFCWNSRMPGLSCRFYQHKFPEVEDVVMVNVRSIAEMGAYVSLLEYNNIEGMILLSELSRRRIRSINKLIRIGRNECVVVIRVDKEKGICGYCGLYQDWFHREKCR